MFLYDHQLGYDFVRFSLFIFRRFYELQKKEQSAGLKLQANTILKMVGLGAAQVDPCTERSSNEDGTQTGRRTEYAEC
jgi:hypothetical protein